MRWKKMYQLQTNGDEVIQVGASIHNLCVDIYKIMMSICLTFSYFVSLCRFKTNCTHTHLCIRMFFKYHKTNFNLLNVWTFKSLKLNNNFKKSLRSSAHFKMLSCWRNKRNEIKENFSNFTESIWILNSKI